MKLAKPNPEDAGIPNIDRCLAHRCERHRKVGLLNESEATGAECGACLAEDTFGLWNVMLPDILDGYAARLTHHAILKAKLSEARVRLNLLQPGAGDFLADDDLEQLAELREKMQ